MTVVAKQHHMAIPTLRERTPGSRALAIGYPVVATVLTALFVLGIRGIALGPHGVVPTSDIGLVVAAAIGAWACARAACRRTGRARTAWRVMTLAMASWMCGETLWTYYELAAGRATPFPSSADAAYLLAIPLACVAVLLLPSAPRNQSSLTRTVLDGALIATALLLVSWSVELGAVVRSSSDGLLEKAISLAYPLGDVLIASFVVFVGVRAPRQSHRMFQLLCAGLLALAVADSAYGYLELHGGYRSGGITDVAWFVGYLLIGFAALRAAPASGVSRDSRPSRIREYLPYAIALPAIALGFRTQLHPGSDPVSLTLFVSVVGLVVARQFFAVAENRSMTIARLVQIDEMRNAFLVATSHEFRTPMTSLLGFAKTLQRPGLPEEQRLEFVRKINSSAERLNGLLTNLLDVDRLARGAFEPRRQETDLRAMVHDVVDGVDLGSRSVSVSSRESDGYIDRSQAERILEALLVNAAKHTPDEARIWIHWTRGAEGVTLAVDDDGPGVPDELRTKIFAPFRQGVVPAYSPGLGIGLALVARLAAAHGGRAWVENRPGGGAAFRVLLAES